MKPRHLAVVAAPIALLISLLCGCSSVSPDAAGINHTNVTRAELNQELSDVSDSPRYVTQLQSQGGQVAGSGPGTYTQGFVASILNQRLRFDLIHDELARRHALPDAAAISAAAQQIPQQFADQQGSFFNQFPASYRTTLIQRQADVQALETLLGTNEADEQFYNAHPAEFATEVCVRHILLAVKDANGNIDFPASKAQATQVRAQLASGADFATLAKADSQDNAAGGSASKGGVLNGSAPDGCLTADDLSQLVAPFVQAVAVLPVNQVSDPIETQFGYHLIEVTSRQVPPYDPSLMPTVSRGVFLDFLSKALQSAKMTVDPQFGRVDRGDPANGDVPTIVPPTGPTFPGTTTTVPDSGASQ